MWQRVDESMFVDRFDDMNRSDNFSILARRALYQYLEELGDDIFGGDAGMELDVIALCCEFSEYDSLKEFHEDYDAEDYPDLDAIAAETVVIEIDGTDGFIVGPL